MNPTLWSFNLLKTDFIYLELSVEYSLSVAHVDFGIFSQTRARLV